MRVVSLNCSNTEIVAALGMGSELVGVDDDSDFPLELVARLPRVGRDLDIDVAKVAALKPDLVLASNTVPGHEQVIAQLAAAKLPFFAPETMSFDDVLADIREIARRLGVPERGDRLAASMDVPSLGHSSHDSRTFADVPSRGTSAHAARTIDGDGRGGVRKTWAKLPRDGTSRPRILVEWWPRPVIVPGAKSWVTDLIEAAGGVNPFGDEGVKSRPVSDEEVVARDPDAVVICWCGVKTENYRPEVVRARAAWRETKALRAGRIHCIPEAFLGRPGPRLVEGLRALREVVAGCGAAAS